MSDQKVFGMRAEQGRWIFVLLGLLMNICLGAVYAFSVFKKPLQELWSINATQSGLPFMIFLAVFAVFMALAGGLVGKWGPRRTGLLGGVLVGAGWILAGFATNITWLTLFYGVIAGAGVGIIYGCPIAVSAKWFPDRKGLAVGLTVMGFGLSALIMAPLMRTMIANASIGPMRTFTYLGIAFTAILVLLSLPLRDPESNWKPAGWSGKAVKGTSGVDLDRKQMVKTGTFYALWGTYTIGCLAGLMAIGISSPVGEEVARLTPSMAAISVSVFAIFNGVGRPSFGWLTDKLTPRYTAVLSFALILVASALLYLWGEGNSFIYFLSFIILWMNLGGWLAIAPTATATLFGTKHYGKNYGLVFTSYGVGALLGGTLAGMIRDASGGYLPVFLPVMGLAVLGVLISIVGLKPVKAKA
jgi:MFS transporter, OFA family, oxalate/formate antiporter